MMRRFSQESGNRASNNAAYQCAGRGETMQEISVGEVRGAREERLQASFRAGDNCRVVTEKQSAEDGDKDYSEKVGP